jgi:predicted nucleic acid-binding protein
MTGRSEGTSLSIDKDIEYTLLAARQTSTEEVIDKTRFAAEEAEYRLQRFNFTFFAAMLVSTAVAGGAAALLTQRLYHARRKQGGSD